MVGQLVRSTVRSLAVASAAFNPLEAARDLEAAGVERRQAEAHAEALRKAVIADRDESATKADLAALEGRFYRALWVQGAGIVIINLAALGLIAAFVIDRLP